MNTPHSALYEEALAELHALRARPADTAPEAASESGQPSCCTGDRRGYQRHQRRGEPACEPSLLANRAYTAAYQRSTGRTTRAGRRRRSGGDRS